MRMRWIFQQSSNWHDHPLVSCSSLLPRHCMTLRLDPTKLLTSKIQRLASVMCSTLHQIRKHVICKCGGGGCLILIFRWTPYIYFRSIWTNAVESMHMRWIFNQVQTDTTARYRVSSILLPKHCMTLRPWYLNFWPRRFSVYQASPVRHTWYKYENTIG